MLINQVFPNKMDKEAVVGIDLGTTNSCVAIKRNGRIEVIPNSEGKRTTLSFVYYNNSEVLVGKTAKHESASKPSNGIYEIKRILGCLHDDPEIEQERTNLIYNLIRGTNGEIKIKLDDKSVQPEEVCARILYKLKIDAESYLGHPVTKAVITVPAYFNNNQRAATRDAARIAGLEVMKLVNEPSAAALAYIQDNPNNCDKTLLIYDLGGGTFDVSILKIQNGKITVLSVTGNTHLGGQDFLNRLVKYVTEEVNVKSNNNYNSRRMFNIIAQCETAKKILTTSKSTTVVLENIELVITRDKFEELNRDLFEETVKIVDNCIKNSKLDKNDIDEVLLVGGSSRIPCVEKLLKNYFGVNTVRRNINADEAIAIGAAIEANSTESVLTDILPLSIQLLLDDEPLPITFDNNTPLPAASKCNYIIKNKKKQGCILSVYEGGNVLLGAHEIKWIRKEATNNIEISVRINQNGIIWINAKGDTIKQFQIVLNKGRLDEEEITTIRQQIQQE